MEKPIKIHEMTDENIKTVIDMRNIYVDLVGMGNKLESYLK